MNSIAHIKMAQCGTQLLNILMYCHVMKLYHKIHLYLCISGVNLNLAKPCNYLVYYVIAIDYL